MLRLGLVTVVAAAVFLVSSAALAAKISVTSTSPTVITFKAKSGEANAFTYNEVGVPPPVAPGFADSLARVVAGEGCVSLDLHSADCNLSGFTLLDVYLRNQDDTARAIMLGHPAHIWGGSGNDTLVADNYAGGTSVYGGPGDDEVSAGMDSGDGIADGGPGDDLVHAGGAAGHAYGFGGAGKDIIDLHAQESNQMVATLDGGAGNDTIIALPVGCTRCSPSTASGGNGDDVIAIEGDPLSPWAYTISGGAGDDIITGGPGDDTVDGGNGRDYIDVRGGGSDSVVCGSGKDVVLYDASDTIAADCESRQAS